MRRLVLVALVVLAVLHQDFWNWHSVDPLIFGFVPVGLSWHVMISLLAAGLAAFIVRFCWPADIENHAGAGERPFLSPPANRKDSHAK